MYLNTKYFQPIYWNTKYIDAFKYFSKYLQNVDLFNPLTFFKMNYILDRIFSSIILHVNKLDWNITDIHGINFITCIRQ